MGQQVYLSSKEASWIISLLDYHDAPVSNDDKLVLTKIREKANSVAVKANRVRRGPRDYNGLSGFLAPDGVFHECAYQEHKDLAVRLVEQYKVELFEGDTNKVPNFIKFGCLPWVDKQGNSGCHVLGQNKPTNEQVTWLLTKLDRMTDVQQRLILGELHHWDIDVSDRLTVNKL
ncbi:hypothetical protein [Paenibacillus sp. PK1-4R]|uniref:hypothetical protein n=1 Tax=Paenibacillus sp. PK1-4R TaxID=3049075 RepID=UPI0025A2BFB0|nr:hypothetical protein [Paenibacillus sp. PK1-4R]WJM05848.1 hypothetical protein QNO02_16325 [Paenibacillus sp. PK1-4R]